MDISGIISKMNTIIIPIRDVAIRIKKLINQEIQSSFPELLFHDDVSDAIIAIVAETKKEVYLCY